jgi:hypothetical protein
MNGGIVLGVLSNYVGSVMVKLKFSCSMVASDSMAALTPDCRDEETPSP